MKKYLLWSSIIALTSCSYEGLNSVSAKAHDATITSLQYFKSRPHAYTKDNLKDKRTFNKVDSSIHYKQGADVVNIKYKDLTIDIHLIDYESYLSLSANKKVIHDKIKIDFNYIYDTDINDAIKDITWLTNSDNDSHVLMLPSATEEFPTYNILTFTKTGLSQSYIIKMRDWNCHNIKTLVFDKSFQPIEAKTNLGKECQIDIINNPPIY